MALSSQVPQNYIIGLRDGHLLEDHLASLGKDINVEQRIPQINGYAIPVSGTNNDVLSKIRRDTRVGFVVEKPREFFSQDGHVGLENDDLTDYLVQRMGLTLQDQDPEVPVTDDDSAIIPLTWRVHFADGNARNRQMSRIGNDITIFDVLSYSYWIAFDDKDQEQEHLPLLKGDPDVVAVYPERSRTGVFFDEDGEDHVKPYISDNIIHEDVQHSFDPILPIPSQAPKRAPAYQTDICA
ncbi:hypothetical protein D6D01_08891 [Aureobasidium pullulans]|uniref:Uncharacterized protein n=1 Tax=Aureobasidium pullulans TaxID=5580 RepID=A0A4S9K769_AURPU|nr:hypothetical protein D6D01_08891 [Aureobasidium pullulans]